MVSRARFEGSLVPRIDRLKGYSCSDLDRQEGAAGAIDIKGFVGFRFIGDDGDWVFWICFFLIGVGGELVIYEEEEKKTHVGLFIEKVN